MRWTLLCSLAALTFACEGARSSTTTSETEGTGTAGTASSASSGVTASSGGESTTTGGDLPEECECSTELDFGCVGEVSCGGRELCPPIEWECPNPVGMYSCETSYQYEAEGIVCAVDALRAGTPGWFRAAGDNDICGLEGCGTDYLQFQILPGRRVVRERCSASPIGGGQNTAQEWTLAEPDYFEGCMAISNPGSMWSCLKAGLLESGELLCE